MNPISISTYGILFLVVYDAILWSAYLYRHSMWLKNHPETMGYCDRIDHKMLAIASVMSGIFSASLAIFWLWYKTMYGYNWYCYSIILSVNISNIHLYALLAHCTSLDVKYWPPISNCVSRCIVNKIKKD